jgi:hypothetical protein
MGRRSSLCVKEVGSKGNIDGHENSGDIYYDSFVEGNLEKLERFGGAGGRKALEGKTTQFQETENLNSSGNKKDGGVVPKGSKGIKWVGFEDGYGLAKNPTMSFCMGRSMDDGRAFKQGSLATSWKHRVCAG